MICHCEDEEANKENLAFGNWMKATRVIEVRRPCELPVNNMREPVNPTQGAFSGGRSITRGKGSEFINRGSEGVGRDIILHREVLEVHNIEITGNEVGLCEKREFEALKTGCRKRVRRE